MAKVKKFGTFEGVFTPSFLSILGVILYLRLPWIVGQAGLWMTLGIIALAHVVSITTGLSIASIATDKKIETGGTYYIISRSLGLPIGGTLGWALFVGLSLSVSLYIIGFSEILLSYFGYDPSLENIRLLGLGVLVAITILTFISTSLTLKSQYLILVVILLSLLSLFMGRHPHTPSAPQLTALPDSLEWIALFAIFFPAVTGFQSGVSMSGDLKDAKKSIPYGVILAIAASLLVYIAIALFLSFTVDSALLVGDKNVLFKISYIPQLILAGVLAATLSSAIGSILSAPRILQAVAQDKIAPSFFGKGYGSGNEPRNALLFAFVIALAGVWIGELNAVARLVSIFFIITYGFINLTFTIESWASSDFRPSFKVPRVVGVIGTVATVVIMIQLDILALIIAVTLLSLLYLYLRRKELTLSTGDSRSSLWHSLVKTGLRNLSQEEKGEQNRRNWRPNIILFSGGVGARSHLVELARDLVGKLGIFTNFTLEVVEQKGDAATTNPLLSSTAELYSERLADSSEVLTRKHRCTNIYEGVGIISSVYGFSGFEPNTILMGWPQKPIDNGPFEQLLTNLSQQDYNLAFLRYDKSKKFGNQKNIDIWWSGGGNTLSFALHIVRSITAAKSWSRANVRVLYINSAVQYKETLHTTLTELLDSYRIKATVKIINNIEKRDILPILKWESTESSLSIVEIGDVGLNSVASTIKEIEGQLNSLGTTLLLKADSSFEGVEQKGIAPEREVEEERTVNSTPSPIISIDHLPEQEPFRSDLMSLAARVESSATLLVKGSLENIKQEREIFIDQLIEKLESTPKTEQERGATEKILFTEYIDALLDDFKANSQKIQIRQLKEGIDRYLKESKKLIGKMPSSVKLSYSKESFKLVAPQTRRERVNKGVSLTKLALFGGSIKKRVKIDPALHYFFFFKRVKLVEEILLSFTSMNLASLAAIKELESYYYNPEEREQLVEALNRAKQLCKRFIESNSEKIINQSIRDFNSFLSFIENPQANLISRDFKEYKPLENRLIDEFEEFSRLYLRFIENNINKTKLDFIYIGLKERLHLSLVNNRRVLREKIEGTLFSFMDRFKAEIESAQKEERALHFRYQVQMPHLDLPFSTLQNEIEDALATLDELLTIGGENLPQTVTTASLKEISEYQISPRKVADFYISNLLREAISKYSFELIEIVTESVLRLKNLLKLANFALGVNDGESAIEANQRKRELAVASLIENIEGEREKIVKQLEVVDRELSGALDSSFEPLSAAAIVTSSTKLFKKSLTSERRSLLKSIRERGRAYSQKLSDNLVSLLYRQSEGVLWATNLEKREELETLLSCQNISDLLESSSPNRAILELLPFYYLNLFTGRSGVGEDFWLGMEREFEKGKGAVTRFTSGSKGMIIITGERGSGKSSLSRHLATTLFLPKNSYIVRPPRESSSNVKEFEAVLYETIIKNNPNVNYPSEYSSSEGLDSLLTELESGSAVIINDLELWWERKIGGTAVVERIIELMRHHSKEILFIINVNRFALKIIDQLTSINSWALDIITCRPFTAKELKEFIISRHQAGGLKFVLNGKEEEQMSGLDYANLFNHLFNLSSGNPGYAVNLWLGAIKNISGNTIYMERPKGISNCFAEQLSSQDALLILQFILHRRFSVEKLASILALEREYIETKIRMLLQRGILVEKYPSIYSINAMLVPQLTEKLKEMELL